MCKVETDACSSSRCLCRNNSTPALNSCQCVRFYGFDISFDVTEGYLWLALTQSATTFHAACSQLSPLASHVPTPSSSLPQPPSRPTALYPPHSYESRYAHVASNSKQYCVTKIKRLVLRFDHTHNRTGFSLESPRSDWFNRAMCLSAANERGHITRLSSRAECTVLA